MRFFIALLAITLASADQGFVFRSYNTYKTYDFGRQYAAIAYELSVPGGDYYVSGVKTQNAPGMTDEGVQALHIVHQSTRYLPRRILDWFRNVVHYHVIASGLETLEGEPLDGRIRYIHFDDNRLKGIPGNFFTNSKDMELISMERNYIESLSADVFRGMSKLRWVSFSGNRIRRLPGTLFATNPALNCISFENNGLTTIGSELVRDLTNLKGASFDGNVCINVAYWNEPSMRTDMTTEFTTNCGGRCDGVARAQSEIDRLEDAIEKLEQKRPKCSYIKKHWANFDNDSDSDSNENSNEDSEEHKMPSRSNHIRYTQI